MCNRCPLVAFNLSCWSRNHKYFQMPHNTITHIYICVSKFSSITRRVYDVSDIYYTIFSDAPLKNTRIVRSRSLRTDVAGNTGRVKIYFPSHHTAGGVAQNSRFWNCRAQGIHNLLCMYKIALTMFAYNSLYGDARHSQICFLNCSINRQESAHFVLADASIHTNEINSRAPNFKITRKAVHHSVRVVTTVQQKAYNAGCYDDDDDEIK